MSSQHATILHDQAKEQYLLVDHNSRNGTTVNGDMLAADRPVPLWSGACVGFGNTSFVFIEAQMLEKLSALGS